MGIVLMATKEYQSIMIGGCSVLTIASGLIYTLDADSGKVLWISYQILAGLGLGAVMQITMVLAQDQAAQADLSAASANSLFFQTAAGAAWISVAQSLSTNMLLQGLRRDVHSISPAMVVAAGATELRNMVSDAELRKAIEAYMGGLRAAFALGIALSIAALLTGVASMVFDRRKLSKGVVAFAG